MATENVSADVYLDGKPWGARGFGPTLPAVGAYLELDLGADVPLRGKVKAIEYRDDGAGGARPLLYVQTHKRRSRTSVLIARLREAESIRLRLGMSAPRDTDWRGVLAAMDEL